MTSPNILYIHAHDAGRLFQPYGYAVDTPNVQAFAETATTFRNAYCTGPTCSPSRAGLLAGCSPHNSGMLGLAHRGFSMDPSLHLCGRLQERGYLTALAGIQHVVPVREALPYERLLTDEHHAFDAPASSRYDLSNAQAAADFLLSSPQRPFFLSFGMFNPHRPFPTKEPADGVYLRPPPPLPDTPRMREDFAAFREALSVADTCVGIVLEALSQSGKEDNTIVIVTTDHGIAFPGMKCNLYDTGMGVALIVRAPGLTSPGTVTDTLVSQIDLYPTICELTNAAVPEWAQGRSLKSVLDGSIDSVRNEVFSEVSYHAAYEPMRCIRTSRYKYIRNFEDALVGPLPANCDDGPSKEHFQEMGYFRQGRRDEELYDLAFDPHETHNLAGHPDLAEVQGDLSRRLKRWMSETEDPLLYGPVSLPRGARINTPDSESPAEPRYLDSSV